MHIARSDLWALLLNSSSFCQPLAPLALQSQPRIKESNFTWHHRVSSSCSASHFSHPWSPTKMKASDDLCLPLFTGTCSALTLTDLTNVPTVSQGSLVSCKTAFPSSTHSKNAASTSLPGSSWRPVLLRTHPGVEAVGSPELDVHRS